MRAVIVLVLSLLVVGCSTAGSGPTPAPTSSASLGPTPTAAASPTAASADRAITLADNGGTISLAVGDEFLLQLGSDFVWTLMPLNESVVARARNVTVVRGAQGVYRAVGPGAVTLAATGDPPCRKVTPPCGAPSILFEVKLVVR